MPVRSAIGSARSGRVITGLAARPAENRGGDAGHSHEGQHGNGRLGSSRRQD
jgi:hypothetical protein